MLLTRTAKPNGPLAHGGGYVGQLRRHGGGVPQLRIGGGARIADGGWSKVPKTLRRYLAYNAPRGVVRAEYGEGDGEDDDDEFEDVLPPDDEGPPGGGPGAAAAEYVIKPTARAIANLPAATARSVKAVHQAQCAKDAP